MKRIRQYWQLTQKYFISVKKWSYSLPYDFVTASLIKWDVNSLVLLQVTYLCRVTDQKTKAVSILTPQQVNKIPKQDFTLH